MISLHRSTGNKWWKTAAAVLVIGGGTALTFILTKRHRSQEKSSSEIAQTVTTPAVFPATKDTTALLSVTEPGQTTLAPAVEKAKSVTEQPHRPIPRQAVMILLCSRTKRRYRIALSQVSMK